MVYEAMQAAKQLELENINVEVISVNMIKPLDEKTILDSVKKTNKVVVCENNNLIGGLYEAICRLLIENHPVKVEGIGVKDQFGQVGKYSDLLKAYNMTPEDIVEAIKKQ